MFKSNFEDSKLLSSNNIQKQSVVYRQCLTTHSSLQYSLSHSLPLPTTAFSQPVRRQIDDEFIPPWIPFAHPFDIPFIIDSLLNSRSARVRCWKRMKLSLYFNFWKKNLYYYRNITVRDRERRCGSQNVLWWRFSDQTRERFFTDFVRSVDDRRRQTASSCAIGRSSSKSIWLISIRWRLRMIFAAATANENCAKVSMRILIDERISMSPTALKKWRIF